VHEPLSEKRAVVQRKIFRLRGNTNFLFYKKSEKRPNSDVQTASPQWEQICFLE